MTFSADEGATDGDRLSRSLELYRDLCVALRTRITQLRTGLAADPDCKQVADAVKSHNRILQTVLDLEGNLGKRKQAWIDGAVVELDLAAARDEIIARLAVWVARRGPGGSA